MNKEKLLDFAKEMLMKHEKIVDSWLVSDDMLSVTIITTNHLVRQNTYYISNVDGCVKLLDGVSGYMSVVTRNVE